MSKTVLFRVNACCNLAHNAFSQSGSDSCICDVALHEIKHVSIITAMWPLVEKMQNILIKFEIFYRIVFELFPIDPEFQIKNSS